MSAEARARFEAGGRFFALQRFDDAAHEYQTAYALSGNAAVLFNLGRALEEGGHLREALDAYERFDRESPSTIDRAPLRERLAAVRARLAVPSSSSSSSLSATARPSSSSSSLSATARPSSSSPPSPPSRALPLGLMIGGGVALATGLLLGITVMSTNAELEAACPNGLCAPPGRDAEVEGARQRALVADVVGGLGLVTLATGVVLWFMRTPRTSTVRTAVVFTGQGAAGMWTF